MARDLAEEISEVLRTVMFCVGAANVDSLQASPRLVGDAAASLDTYVGGLDYTTDGAGHFIDITDDVAGHVKRSGIRNGIVQIYSKHTTAAIRINEHEPLLLSDFRRLLDRIAPPGSYEHDELEKRANVPPDEPLNARAHLQHLLLSSSESLPVVEGEIQLGTWQRVFLVELCSPRHRQVTVQVLGT